MAAGHHLADGRRGNVDHLVTEHLTVGDFVADLLDKQIEAEQTNHYQLQQGNGEHDAHVQGARRGKHH